MLERTGPWGHVLQLRLCLHTECTSDTRILIRMQLGQGHWSECLLLLPNLRFFVVLQHTWRVLICFVRSFVELVVLKHPAGTTVLVHKCIEDWRKCPCVFLEAAYECCNSPTVLCSHCSLCYIMKQCCVSYAHYAVQVSLHTTGSAFLNTCILFMRHALFWSQT